MRYNNPEAIVASTQRPTIEGLAREHSAKAALRGMYERRAKSLGMSYSGYCARFGIKVSPR